MYKTDKIFEILDEIIEDFIGKEHAERSLTETYFEFWTTLKEKKVGQHQVSQVYQNICFPVHTEIY